MIHVRSGSTGQQYAYGIVGQGRSFYVYVYRPQAGDRPYCGSVFL